MTAALKSSTDCSDASSVLGDLSTSSTTGNDSQHLESLTENMETQLPELNTVFSVSTGCTEGKLRVKVCLSCDSE